MRKHQELHRDGQHPSRFIMRMVKQSRSALEIQVGEAIRIKRRGEAGAILNSKSEYNRCYIPRLQLEDIREEQKREEEQSKEEEELQNILEENFAGLEPAREATREQLDRDKRSKLRKLGSLRKQ